MPPQLLTATIFSNASFHFLPVDNNLFLSVCNYFFFAFISFICKNTLQLPIKPTVSNAGNVIFTEGTILPKLVKLRQIHCFLKYTDMIFGGSTWRFIHVFPGSDKSGLMKNFFKGEILLLVSVGTVLEHGKTRHKKKKITLFCALYMATDVTEWDCLMGLRWEI